MDHRRIRASGCLAALAALTLVAGCSTSIAGSGRPATARSGGSGAATTSGSASAPFDATGDARDVWARALDASTSTDGSVGIGGLISYADVDGARIKGFYSTDDDGHPVANLTVTTSSGDLTILATGGHTWARGAAAVYRAYGFDAPAAGQAAGKDVVVSDDDSVLAPLASLEGFLQLYGPVDDDPASVAKGTFGSKHPAVIVRDDKYHTLVYLEPSNGHAFAASAGDETVLFDEQPDRTTVEPPDDADVVTVDGF